MEAFGYTRDDLLQSLADVARIMSIPKRDPRWVKPTFWDYPLNETRTRPVPANSGWLDYITIHLGVQPGFAPEGYSLRLMAFVGTTLTDPLTNGVTYRFLKNGFPLPAQEIDITNNIEKGILRYSGVPAPWPAYGRKIFLTVQNQGRLVLQVNNPSGDAVLCPAALFGYYFPNLGDLPKGSLERARDESETDRGN
jgi:hypothetical protein